MGNTDSQYSSFIIPSRSRPCSLKINTSRQEALSPHSWWRSAGGGTAAYRSRSSSRNGHNQHNNSPPYASHHCEYLKSNNNNNKQQHGSIQNSSKLDYECLLAQQNSCYVQGSSPQPSARSSGSEGPHKRNSPKVLFSQDGSLRVEFTNVRPELDDVPKDSTLRDSKGSSLSSEASWYDSPWGTGTDLCDNVFTNGQPSDNSSGYTTLSSTRTEDFISCPAAPLDGHVGELIQQPYSEVKTNRNQYNSNGYISNGYITGYSGRADEDSGIGDSVLLSIDQKDLGLSSLGDLYTNPNQTGPFPTTGILPTSQVQELREENAEVQAFSSLTLPCRKPVTDSNSRKDSLKSRIRRLSDWTGSLSRKKRRLQEPSAVEVSEPLSSGLDSLLSDSSLQLGSGSYWNSLVSSQTQSACSLSDPLQQSQRQNVYENFMQDLELGGGGGGAVVEPLQWECDGEQAESSSGSLGSLEQMELLFEKEQGVVRRAGWLAFKPLISLHKERKLELLTRRRWRQYWVTLKGCTLLLSEANGKGFPEQEDCPRYALQAEDSIVQAVPEHPKKEHVFCLSNAYGDVYLFQTANQTDLENWVTAIHSASASHLAKRQGKEDTLKLLRNQSKTLLQKIDMDSKMKKMAELQLSVISDQKNRKAVESQIQQWEQNLEKFNMELFRMRCYLASLQGSEPPNPKNLLATAGRPSKMTLSRLGIFSVSSFHALMCTRDEATLKRRSRCQSRGARSKRGIFSSQKGLDSLTRQNHEKRQSLSQIFEGHPPGSLCHPSVKSSSEQRLDGMSKQYSTAAPEGQSWDCPVESLVLVSMPDGQAVSVPVKQDFLVSDLLCLACKGRQLDPTRHCLCVKRRLGQDVESSTPAPSDQLRDLVYDEVEVCPLDMLTLNMSRPDPAMDFGFAVTGHVDGLRRSHIYVSEVHPEGLAFAEGLRAGDEVLAVNGVSVSTLDLGLIHTFFSQQTLRLVLRREEPVSDDQGSVWPECDSTDAYCPPPPPNLSYTQLGSSDVSQFLEVPGILAAPLSEELCDKAELCRKSTETVCTLYQPFPEEGLTVVDGYRNPYSTDSGPARGSPRHMSVTERLHKVIQELVDTEKSYVKDLGCLFEIYLKPLERQTFLSHGEMESLFGSLPEMLDFQRVFLQTLEEGTTSSPDFRTLEAPEQLKKLLFSLGGSFLYYADHFKLYSGFCANHIKVQKVLERVKTDRAFKEFLEARNPTKQHSSSLESYLIKPVQRVLKYPLLLRELVSLTDPDSEEHSHLTEALRAMEKVASHINEMQKIYEDYGTVFDQLVTEQSNTEKEVTEISMGEFIIRTSAHWLNPLPSLGRMRKDPELTLFVFKRAVILVYRESSKLKKRMTSSRSGDLDPFKFRWLIPASSVHVWPGNSAGSENPCLWELVHTKSEVEGRPETVFQLCSSNLENKANAVKAIRSILRENAKKNLPVERGSRDNLTFPRRSHPAAVRTSSWLQRLQPQSDGLKRHPVDSDEGRLLGGDTHSEPVGSSRIESKRARLCSLTNSLETQLQRLSFMDSQEAGHRSSRGLQARQVTLLEDSSVGVSTLLVRDCSVQNLSSAVSEDCFYRSQKAAIPTL